MNRIIGLVTLSTLFVLSFAGCKKEKKTDEIAGKITLTAERETIRMGETVKIRAEVENFEATSYQWCVDKHSALRGEGNEVELYAHCSSCLGPNRVTCKASNAKGQAIEATIIINVKE